MKKNTRNIVILVIAILAVGLVSYSLLKSNNNISLGFTPKITYTEEIKYVPSYNQTKATQVTTPTDKSPFTTARYTIKDTTDEKVYKDYEKMLKKDGWTIAQGQQYFAISAKKDKHMANFLFQKAGKDLILVIISK
ncbi:hypothetical protein [Clostridium sp. OS1-26]|uniref:hypothetical protein n=1 Tax=Clostridium sp. OS1-26 TaxID=3070681 RepID=UPI0027E08D36|nr:hypothetical protein [Clostridium sp. OS1-26]WML36734.1 hypothetical protein RCG18_08955 [Clostridium sp. OS1-26]